MPVINCDSVVFDCDGVILDSNRLKSDAFGAALSQYDPKAVDAFVDWHRATGGVSRYAKFERFFSDYIHVDDPAIAVQGALKRFAAIVENGLLNCDYIAGFETLAQSIKTAGHPCSVNTGGDETEVRGVFEKRGISLLFDIIYGSPTTKRQNMVTLKEEGRIGDKGLYLGDSKLDFDLAMEFEMKFIFVSGKSEWRPSSSAFTAADVVIVEDLTSIQIA